MNVFVTYSDTGPTVIVRARAESPDKLGDAIWTIKPGEKLLGRSYEWWNSLPPGRNELESAK